MKAREPITREEWQEAVNAAYFCRCLWDCWAYGFITDPGVNIARVDDILTRGEAIGVVPTITVDDVAREIREGAIP